MRLSPCNGCTSQQTNLNINFACLMLCRMCKNIRLIGFSWRNNFAAACKAQAFIFICKFFNRHGQTDSISRPSINPSGLKRRADTFSNIKAKLLLQHICVDWISKFQTVRVIRSSRTEPDFHFNFSLTLREDIEVKNIYKKLQD